MRGPLRSREPLGPSDREVCAGPVRGALEAQRRTRPRGLPASIPLMTRMDRTPSPTARADPLLRFPILGPASAGPQLRAILLPTGLPM